MHPTPLQPISVFCKENQLYRILDMIRLPPTTNAMQEILSYSMHHQEFIAPSSLIGTFSDLLQVSERTIKTGFAQLEESSFIVDRGRKNCVINPFLANKYDVVPGHLLETVVQPNPCTPRELEIIQKVNKMRSYNHALNHPAYIQSIDQMAVQFARDAVFNEKVNQLQTELHKVTEELIGLKNLMMDVISKINDQDTQAKVKRHLELVVVK